MGGTFILKLKYKKSMLIPVQMAEKWANQRIT
jgi:hypothetical protein